MQSLKALKVIIHMAGWLMFFSLPLIFMSSDSNRSFTAVADKPSYWFFCGFFLLLFYFSFYLLIPRLYLQRRFITFGGVIILLLFAVYLLRPFDRLMSENRPAPPPQSMVDNEAPRPPADKQQSVAEHPVPQGPQPLARHFDIVSIVLFVMIIAVSMTIQINRQLHLSEKKAIKAESDKAAAELSFLKAQINPHFLFNILNNIYTMAISEDPNTAQSILKLSNIMRYVTDDAGSEKVPLEDEVNCLSDYIGLQKLRLGKKTLLDFSVLGDIRQQKIAPLILMSFVENVFKYGVSKHYPSTIRIGLNISDSVIHFYTENQIFKSGADINRTGIGIRNTKKRLEQIYPQRHDLNIRSQGNMFTVDLTLRD